MDAEYWQRRYDEAAASAENAERLEQWIKWYLRQIPPYMFTTEDYMLQESLTNRDWPEPEPSEPGGSDE